MNEMDPRHRATLPGSVGGVGNWVLRAFPDAEALHQFADQARRDLQIREFQHDPEWLDAQSTGRPDGPVLLAVGSGADIHGLLAARVATLPFTYSAGAVTVFRKTVRHFTVHQGPIGQGTADPQIVGAGFCALARHMPSDAVTYVSAVPVGSAVHRTLEDPRNELRGQFHVLPWGQQNPHFKIQWDGSVNAYLSSLSAKRRGNVKRASQRSSSTTPHAMRRFQHPSDIDAFLKDAIAISAQSGQDSGVGFDAQPGGAREALIRFAATRGAFTGYIMYVGESPVAYRYGFIYGHTLFAISTAYDRAWSEHKPGAVIFFEMLQDLENSKVPIKLIDLLPHENAFKRDRANIVVATQNYFLFKRSIAGSSLFYSVRALEASKPAVKTLLTWYRRLAP